MDEVEGARSFRVEAGSYDRFMGRYSRPLSRAFLDAAGVVRGGTALDVGCGPGALTEALVDRLGADKVSACDPSPSFLEEFARRHPDVLVRVGRAESLPFDDRRFDHVLAQLVFHFISDPEVAVAEFARVAKPGAIVGACVWDFDDGMEMLRCFWDAALALDPDAPDEARTLRFSRQGEIAELFDDAGLVQIDETTLDVSSSYADFDELWDGFMDGVGPAGSYCVSLDEREQGRLRELLFQRLDEPTGTFTLNAVARMATGRTTSVQITGAG